MDRNIFNGLFKDLMSHVYDVIALDTHPLTEMVSPPASFTGSRGEFIQKLIFSEIEKMQPLGKEYTPTAFEWRPYIILRDRYIKGANLQELSNLLSLSERQLRRDHSRALQALAGRLWDQFFQNQLAEVEIRSDAPVDENNHLGLRSFEIHPEALDLGEVLRSVMDTMQKRVQEQGSRLEITLSEIPLQILADRIILRQILISLLSYALHLQSETPIQVSTQKADGEVRVQIRLRADENWSLWFDDEHEDMMESARYWSDRLGAQVQENYPPRGKPGFIQLHLSLPGDRQATILVVDDQKPTLRMYKRYLSRSDYKIVGVSEPSQVLPLARELQPVLITLDVMMPYVDGWEILQGLKSDAKTRHIPVIVCSAWEEPELAKSLGATNFLKKPITQKALISALEQLNLPV